MNYILQLIDSNDLLKSKIIEFFTFEYNKISEILENKSNNIFKLRDHQIETIYYNHYLIFLYSKIINNPIKSIHTIYYNIVHNRIIKKSATSELTILKSKIEDSVNRYVLFLFFDFVDTCEIPIVNNS